MKTQQGRCSICGLDYQVICPMHPDAEQQVEDECYLGRCSAEKHIVIPCDCDPDHWQVVELLHSDRECCARGVCGKHQECEEHGDCPQKGAAGGDDEERCPYEYVGQCCSFFVGPNGERGRCPNSLDGVADSCVCPEDAKRFYPQPLCTRGCGGVRRLCYDSMSGAWMRVCACDDSSSSEEKEPSQGGEKKKQKIN